MSSRKKACVFEALSRKNRFWFRNDNDLTTTTIPGEIRFKSSATTSSGRFLSSDFEGNKRIPRARSLNSVMRKDSNRKRAILPPETNGHATILSKDSKKAEAVIEDKNKLCTSEVSPSVLSFTGGTLIPVTSYLHIVTPDEDTPRGVWPIFRMMVRFEVFHTIANLNSIMDHTSLALFVANDELMHLNFHFFYS